MKKSPCKSPDATELRRRAEKRVKEKPGATGQIATEADLRRLYHELEVHQIELEMQNEELHHAQAETEAVLGKYTDLYDFAPVGYFTLKRDGAILQMNLTGAHLLGVERSRLMNGRFGHFVSDDSRHAFNAFLEKTFTGKTREFWEGALPQKGTSPLFVRIEAMVSEDGQECRAAMVDITERKQIEDAQMFLVQCGLPASGEDFFKSLARYLAENLGMDYVCIDRLQEEGLVAQTVAIYFDGEFEDNLTYALKDTPCGDVVEKTICCFPNGVRHLYPRDVVLQEMMAESYVGTILWSSKAQPIGLIAIIGRQPLANSQLAKSMLNLVAVRAAGELESREAEEALRKRSLELQQLTETLEQRVLERTTELARTNEALRHLSTKLLSAQEDERKRIASELHDTIGSCLNAIKFKLETVQQRIGNTPNVTSGALNTIIPIVQESIDECRRIQMDLRPSMLDDLGLLATLSWFCRRFETIYSEIRIEQEIEIKEGNVQSPLKIVVYRVIQETMNNIAKHSHATLVRLSLRKLNDRMELILQDNGQGFNSEKVDSQETTARGLGLTSMRERTELSGGSFDIESTEGKGTIIRASWPLRGNG